MPTKNVARALPVLSNPSHRCLLPELVPPDPSTRAEGTRRTAGRHRALGHCRNTRRPKGRGNSSLPCPLDHLALATTLGWEWIRARGLGVAGTAAAGALELRLCSPCSSSTCRRRRDRWGAEVPGAGTTGVGLKLCEVSTRATRLPMQVPSTCFLLAYSYGFLSFFFPVFLSLFSSWVAPAINAGRRFLSTILFCVCCSGLSGGADRWSAIFFFLIVATDAQSVTCGRTAVLTEGKVSSVRVRISNNS